MAPGSIIGRMQGTLNQPHGIPQLDKDRKVMDDQLGRDMVNGVAGLNGSGNLLIPGSFIEITRDGTNKMLFRRYYRCHLYRTSPHRS